jgi:hypothetical protein
VQPGLLLFVGDVQVGSDAVVCDGADVTILSPMAGGQRDGGPRASH